MPATASLGDSFRSFFDSVDKFISKLAEIQWGSLVLALAFFGVYLTIRSRAYFHVLRAAYPDQTIQWRRPSIAATGTAPDRRRWSRR